MTTLLIAATFTPLLKGIAIFCICTTLVALRCLAECLLIMQWYREQYHSQPRVNKCPVRMSGISKLFLALFAIKLAR